MRQAWHSAGFPDNKNEAVMVCGEWMSLAIRDLSTAKGCVICNINTIKCSAAGERVLLNLYFFVFICSIYRMPKHLYAEW